MSKQTLFFAAVLASALALNAGALEVGDPAPEVHAGRWWNGPAAERLSEPGETVHVVAFWATWSRPSTESLRKLAELQENLGTRGVRIIALAKEDEAALDAYLAGAPTAKALTLATDDQGQTTAAWLLAAGQSALPHAFVVDRQGRVAWHGHPDDVQPIVEQVLAGTFKIEKPQPPAAEPAGADVADVAADTPEDRPPSRRRRGEAEENDRVQPDESPTPAELRRLLARAVQAQQWEQAVQLIDALVEHVAGGEDADELPGLLSTKFVFLYEMLNNYNAAEATARRLLELERDDAEALNTLAWTLLAGGDFESLDHRWPEITHEAARRALEASERRSSAIIDTYARSLYMLGHVESAVEWQEKAIEQARTGLDRARTEGAGEEFLSRLEGNLTALGTTLDYYQQILQYRRKLEQ
jgi:tetratricopeptide (TPR) repeat protein